MPRIDKSTETDRSEESGGLGVKARIKELGERKACLDPEWGSVPCKEARVKARNYCQ